MRPDLLGKDKSRLPLAKELLPIIIVIYPDAATYIFASGPHTFANLTIENLQVSMTTQSRKHNMDLNFYSRKREKVFHTRNRKVDLLVYYS